MSSRDPLFPGVSPSERFYERASAIGLVVAVFLWLPLWALSPLQLLALDKLHSFVGGSAGIGVMYVVLLQLLLRVKPEQMSLPWLLEVMPKALALLRLSLANLWMAFLLPILTLHLLVWSPGFVDEHLVVLERMIGLDHFSATMWSVETGLRAPLVWAYNSLWAQSVVLLVWWVAIRRSTERLWGLTALSVWGGLLALPVFFFMPALGPVTQHAGYPSELVHPAYELLRGVHSGELRALTRLDGVVSIPSFHTFFALSMVWGAWGERPLLAVLVPLNAVVLVSVYLVGFHYLIDIVAGVAWFAAAVYALEWGRRWAVAE